MVLVAPADGDDYEKPDEADEAASDLTVALCSPVQESKSLAESGQGLTVDTLRALFRGLMLWRAIYESDGVEILPLPDGSEISIYDVEYLLSLSRDLPIRHRQAIYLCLVEGHSEEDAAYRIGIDSTNPVATSATAGLYEILTMVELGLAPTRAEVYAREAIRRNRSLNAQVEESPDFGPNAIIINYELYN
jgi:hypothetical protein